MRRQKKAKKRPLSTHRSVCQGFGPGASCEKGVPRTIIRLSEVVSKNNERNLTHNFGKKGGG